MPNSELVKAHAEQIIEEGLAPIAIPTGGEGTETVGIISDLIGRVRRMTEDAQMILAAIS